MTNILTEQDNPASLNIDLLKTEEILRLINNEDIKVAAAVKKALPEITAATDLIVDAFLKGGRLAYFGAGTSGRLGVLDASECQPTFSTPENMISAFIAGGDTALRYAVEDAEDSKKEALNQIKKLNPTSNDVIVGISASGNPLYVLTILKEAQKHGAKTIGITSNPAAKLASLCDVCITTVVGPEIITGSSRMKSGTAQKMVLNMLSTTALIKIGKTYGNHMIDLQLTNKKLIKRGNGIIAAICNIPLAKAEEYRIKAGNNIKTACVMYKKRCSKQTAEQILKQHNGILRKAFKDEKLP